MSFDLKSFLKENVVDDESVKYVVSNRFKDSKGEPIAWELRAINSDLDEKLRKESTKKVPISGKRGAYTSDTDTDKYLGKLCVASIINPNLNDATLQDSYGAKDAESVLKAMLKAGEYVELKAKVAEINGYDTSMEELVEDAKN